MSVLTQFTGSGETAWVSGRNYIVGEKAISPTDFCVYVRKIAGAGATDPASDSTNWQPFGERARKSIQYASITINATATSGTATISSVNTAKSKIFHLGASSTSSAAYQEPFRLSLTNATTVTATGYATAAMTCNVMIVETY